MKQLTTIITDILPVNLGAFGVEQQGNGIDADLITIWNSPYLVLTKYKVLCARLNIEPFGGGTWRNQGDPNKRGYITSGYRKEVLHDNILSPHRYAFAIDVAIGDIHAQLTAGAVATDLFPRVGLYPANGFIHLDLSPEVWLDRHGKKHFWCNDREQAKKASFDTWHEMKTYVSETYTA